jgi:hypothetical protein
VALPLVTAPAHAQGSQSSRPPAALAPYRSRILGMFDRESGDPIRDAEVIDLSTGTRARTTETGTVSLAFLQDGGSMVRVRKLGYEPQTFWVAISPTDTSAITLILEKSGQTLPAVTTVVKGPLDSVPHWLSHNLRDFEERRRTGQGSFLSEDILRKEEDRTLANVLKTHVTGIDIVESALSHIVYLRSRRVDRDHPRGCYPDVYLDGTPLRDQPGKPTNLSEWNVRDFSAIEVHDVATTPPQFSGTGSGCGVLLLWSRER